MPALTLLHDRLAAGEGDDVAALEWEAIDTGI
jgi:hypothetical protein